MGETILDSDVRDDLRAAHAGFIAGLGQPGTWWTAAERLDIARAVRTAAADSERPPWAGPSGRAGIVWRITNHPGTLTSEWYDSIADTVTPSEYVELVGIVAGLTAVDRLAEALDFDPIPLPSATPGEPSRAEVEASVTSHWVPTTDARGPNVFLALSAVPAAWEATRPISASHYVPQDKITGDLTWSRDALSRPQIELVAAATSQANECFY